MPVEGFKGGLEASRQLQRVKGSPLAPPLLGHVLPDVLPEVTVDGHLLAGDVLGNGNPRELDNAALDRVHERKVIHDPREQSALGVA